MNTTDVRLGLTAQTTLAIADLLPAGCSAGPVVVTSIAYMDPGNFATDLQAGTKYGYSLRWVVLATNVIAMLFRALQAKPGIATNRNFAETSRKNFLALSRMQCRALARLR